MKQLLIAVFAVSLPMGLSGCWDRRPPVTSKYTVLYFYCYPENPRYKDRHRQETIAHIDNCPGCLQALSGAPALQTIELAEIPNWQQQYPSLAGTGDSIGLVDPNGKLLGTVTSTALASDPEGCINMLLQGRSAIEIQEHAIASSGSAIPGQASFRCELNFWLAKARRDIGDQQGFQAAMNAAITEIQKEGPEDQRLHASISRGRLERMIDPQSSRPLLAEFAQRYLTAALEGNSTAANLLFTTLLFDDKFLGDLNPLFDQITAASPASQQLVLNAIRLSRLRLLVRAGRFEEAIQVVANPVDWARKQMTANAQPVGLSAPFPAYTTPEGVCDEVVALGEALYATGRVAQGDAVYDVVKKYEGDERSSFHLQHLKAARVRGPVVKNGNIGSEGIKPNGQP